MLRSPLRVSKLVQMAGLMKLRRRQVHQVLIWLACLSAVIAFTPILPTTHSSAQLTVVKVHFKPDHPASKFDPSVAFGAAIDGHEKGELNQMLSRENVSEMLTAGLKPISYRLRTELAGEVW